MKGSNTPTHADLLKEDLNNRIRGKVAVAAIGNILRGDDGLGPKFIELLKARGVKTPLFDCGTVPENYIFPILSTSSDTVILIDAADLGQAPGSVKALDLTEITNASFSTHNPSPRLFADLLKTGRDDLNIFAISIQPKSSELGEPISKEVLDSLDILAGTLSEIIG